MDATARTRKPKSELHLATLSELLRDNARLAAVADLRRSRGLTHKNYADAVNDRGCFNHRARRTFTLDSLVATSMHHRNQRQTNWCGVENIGWSPSNSRDNKRVAATCRCEDPGQGRKCPGGCCRYIIEPRRKQEKAAATTPPPACTIPQLMAVWATLAKWRPRRADQNIDDIRANLTLTIATELSEGKGPGKRFTGTLQSWIFTRAKQLHAEARRSQFYKRTTDNSFVQRDLPSVLKSDAGDPQSKTSRRRDQECSEGCADIANELLSQIPRRLREDLAARFFDLNKKDETHRFIGALASAKRPRRVAAAIKKSRSVLNTIKGDRDRIASSYTAEHLNHINQGRRTGSGWPNHPAFGEASITLPPPTNKAWTHNGTELREPNRATRHSGGYRQAVEGPQEHHRALAA